MWFVRLALRRPYTFVVAAMLVVILAIVTIARMPTDIFPEINIPVIAVCFNYGGMTPQDIEGRIVTNFERILTTTVNGIEHIESQSLNGIGVVKVYFHPGTKIEEANAQVTAIAQTAIRSMPPGTQPPLIIQYSASNVPILQLGLSSDTLAEQTVFDLANTVIRTSLATVQGAQVPYPYGGKQPQIMVDLDPERLYAWGISAADVSDAIAAQNLILPAGTTKIGKQEYPVILNSSPLRAEELNDLPIKTVRGTTVYIKDVAHVRNGFLVQNSIVHADGKRGVLMVVYKSAGASTLDIVRRVKSVMPSIQAQLPTAMKVTPLFDQSIFVRASVNGVIYEAAMAAGLTGLMILLFLGSWRSTLIVCISIPLSILVSIIVLSWFGQTLNVMTLGGMALAVGILVDDATVAIENIHRNLGQNKQLLRAVLDGSQQIALPAFVSTLCICIVFVPVVFISGAAKFLFTSLAMAVVFAMLTSYVVSRTLLPTMVHYLLGAEVEWYGGRLDEETDAARRAGQRTTVMRRFHDAFNRRFERLRNFYGGLLTLALEHRVAVTVGFGIFILLSCFLYGMIGKDFFPSVDAGLIRLHVRAPPGTRIEQTERIYGQVETAIRNDIPPQEIDTLLDNIGIPNSSINLALSDMSLMSAADGEILISLNPRHHPTEAYMEKLDKDLRRQFPDEAFFFQPADLVTQVLNFGIAAPIDIEIAGAPGNGAKDLQIARRIETQVAAIPGAADVRLQQVPITPDLRVDVDRTLADQVGLTQRDVVNNVLVSLSGTAQLSPNFWLNPRNNVQYGVLVQTPQYYLDTLAALRNTPVVPGAAARSSGGWTQSVQLLNNLARFSRQNSPTNITHDNVRKTFDVLAGVRGSDLGSVAAGVDRVVAAAQKTLPRGSDITVRGQALSMTSSFADLSYGLIFSVMLVYLLMVINFQSWLDPLIILMALPGALCGILWMLFATGTTISVPSLMGAIMSIGVATANSILVITFANDLRKEGLGARDAALAAGLTRLRPVLMTAAAMIIGMLPMSLGLGEGGEQNAPLGRAVIGGLLLATFATLFFVPVVYSKLREKAPITHVPEELQ
ncbi:MAG: efflux RND transporter permease subunit [Tepidisphaeraceae bacterium]|jgi:multidrug efflux pump subunit AcrB